MAYLPIKSSYTNPYLKMEDELKSVSSALPSTRPAQQPQTPPLGTVKTPEQPEETRDFGITAAIISAIAAIASTAAGAATSASAEDDALKQQEKLEKQKMKEEKEELEKQRKERGLQTLAEQRFNAEQRARTRNFNKQFLRAYAQKAIGGGGPGTTTLGGT